MVFNTFSNEPNIIWGNDELVLLQNELKKVKSKFNKRYPLYIGGKEVFTKNDIISNDPSYYKDIVGKVSSAGVEHVDDAIKAAKKASKIWRDFTFKERAHYLNEITFIVKEKKMELVSWLIYESGKTKEEAAGELNEALDFLEMYRLSAMELNEGLKLTPMDGKKSWMEYHPLGVGVIISPWNFPFAILLGLTVSALVTGNTVIIKPSSLTPVVAAKFMEILQKAKFPDGVINFIPGSSRTIGDHLVSHEDIHFISFTGSMDAALKIDELAHTRTSKQRVVKRVIGEMGGKNGIVVDKTANLDQAAEAIVVSAFGYQGQKCSAGSRAIIHQDVYDELVGKILERTKVLTVGPSKDNHFIGPVIDEQAFDKITKYIDIGQQEGTLLYGGESDKKIGFYIDPTVFIDVDPKSTIMQDEIFGPVLAVCKVAHFKEGIDVYNDTNYGLTGSVYTEDRTKVAYAQKHMKCGNLFINQKCTGAHVGVEPFGGYYMSGTGAKIGIPEFLLNFLQQKTISESVVK